MRSYASSSRLLLESASASRTAPPSSRSLHNFAPTLEAWKERSSRNSSAKQLNEQRKQNKVTDTILTASRLGRHADSISKDQSDRFSGWKRTPGPSTRRNVGRPKLSHEAGKSLSRAVASDNVETLLGSHASSVLLQPLLNLEKDCDAFEVGSSHGQISARDFMAPRRDLRPGDFVEVRRNYTGVGIVLPPPDDVMSSNRDKNVQKASAGLKDLYVLVASGQIVLYKDNDVMIQIPGVIETKLARAAAALSKQYVVSSNSLDSPANRDGSYDSHASSNTADVDPTEGTAMQEEPIDIPRFETRASICNKLRILERQKEKELQRLLPSFQSLFLIDSAAQQTEEAEELRKQRMDLRTGAITTFEAARLMHKLQAQRKKGDEDQPFTASTVYAAHALLMSHPTHFLADALSHRTSQLFTCRSDAERGNTRLISDWISGPPGSEGQQHIEAFCHKASKLRQYAEEHPHDLSGAPRIVSAPNKDLEITWTPQDRSIIEFLEASLGSRREVQEDTHGSIAMQIVKRAGGHFRILPHPNTSELMEVDQAMGSLVVDQGRPLGKSILQMVGTDAIAGPDLQHALVVQFLTAIGRLPPWQNPIRLDASFRSATMGEDGGRPEDELSDKEVASSIESPAKKYGLTLDQQVEAMRHDFGQDHTVYVIDDEGAFELDDGISIERVHSQEQAWVHIHIADPTAWIQPDDEIAQRAERRFSTLYFPEARWATLPDDFVRGGVGLRPASEQVAGVGQRVMTFSALVDLSTGLVQDTKVRPALVHDVQTTSYSHVNDMLSDKSAAKPSDLSLLLQVATKLSESRTRSTAFVAHRVNPSVRVSPLPLPELPLTASALQKPYFFAGFPTIDVTTAGSATNASPSVPALSQFLVSELMLLAGRIAASYGKTHDLALAYRYQLRPDSPRDIDELLSMRTHLPSDGTAVAPPVSAGGTVGHGLVAYHDIVTRGLTISAGGYSVQPAEHFSLGIGTPPSPSQRDALSSSGYVRATSPLRRYPDMLVHWQIKHHLVHSSPRFGTHEIERVLPQLERQERSTKQLMRSANRFWVHALLQRSLLDPTLKEGRLDGPFKATVVLPDVRFNAGTLGARVRVEIAELGIPADMEWGTSEAQPTAGDTFEVRPVAVVMAGIRSGLTVRRC
ncbi:Nucleic acid-binding, OB-fold [Kalmanozyma brasiliensis GHG001]|uniref:Nucleic acid-binding, OB-fold n=1 Tax=Kalmanozyma brasiliensis (strain GHG001) TaxID=1365824 RepID=UPI002867E528|nr:Nucleic acid-binding, OB-fold [Kalmanozyma brasiliensis GHG001]KAF6767666.1 Nucleic acid-binding, OB-fold [Kalmanozyma brasiliensis GHG001]